MTRARVALVVPVFPARSETFIVSKAAGLIADGWDVHVICQRWDARLFVQLPAPARELLRGRIHAGWLHRPKWLAALLAPAAITRCFLRRPVGTVRYLARGGTLRKLYLDAELLLAAPEIVHFEFGALAVGRMYLRGALKAPIVVSFRGYDLNVVGLEDRQYYGDVWVQATAVHLLGEDLWKRAQKRGCPPQLLHVLIPPAIDADFFTPGDREECAIVGTEARPLRILSVGRLDWRKGYEYALEAVRALIDRGIVCEYHIVGDGEFHTATAYARYQLGLTKAVTLLGALPPAEVRDEMRWADVMLHAAVSEGFCNVVLEGQAMRLSVVCTNAGGLSENVVDGETGLIVTPREPTALANAMERLAGDPKLRARLGTAGRERVLERFRLADQVAAFRLLYERVLKARAVDGFGAERLSLENDAAR